MTIDHYPLTLHDDFPSRHAPIQDTDRRESYRRVESSEPVVRKSKRLRYLCLLLGVVIVIIILIVLLVVFVGASSSQKGGETVVTDAPVTMERIKNIDVPIKTSLDREFVDALDDPNSNEYKALEKEYTQQLDEVFSKGDLKDVYVRTEVDDFSPGSVEVTSRGIFSGAPESDDGPPLGPDGGIDLDALGQAIKTAVQARLDDAEEDGDLDDIGFQGFEISDPEINVQDSDENDETSPKMTTEPSQTTVKTTTTEQKMTTTEQKMTTAGPTAGSGGLSPSPVCTPWTFECSNGNCVKPILLCNGEDDCGDGSDERLCANCPSEYIRCGDECEPNTVVCDGILQCENLRDEARCICPADGDYEACLTGVCIPNSWRCDYFDDCGDSSDEANCTCLSDDFQCGDGVCIPGSWECDGERDCSDGSDEESCVNQCLFEDELPCENGECIPPTWFCDGEIDCTDASDEFCPECPEGSLECVSSSGLSDGMLCLPSLHICDGVEDCEGGIDEAGCQGCREGLLDCGDGTCAELSEKCDGVSNCNDGSDETDCVCEVGDEWQCDNEECIDPDYLCDYFADCKDGSDELQCQCGLSEFQCEIGGCVHLTWVCDEENDCFDGSDEIGCSTCTGPLQHICDDGECLAFFLDSWQCDGEADCRDGSDELDCVCEEGDFVCDNGACLHSYEQCDGVIQCVDGSDERGCEYFLNHSWGNESIAGI
ncbi:uncharacterized protein [Amphiura filiformis]|uniref:uncharacterized protein n=1 Tax=Amphiura filiformis TaxID=82378 RepID=UPI003B21E092